MWFCPLNLNLDVSEAKGVKTILKIIIVSEGRKSQRISQVSIPGPLVLCPSAGFGHYQTCASYLSGSAASSWSVPSLSNGTQVLWF